MSPSRLERVFDKSYASELLRLSEADLHTAVSLRAVSGVRIENAVYHVQQSIEKILKAVLVQAGLPVPLVHDLGILVSKVPEKFAPPYGYELQRLTDFATIRRYEEGDFTMEPEELDQALKVGTDMLSWGRALLNPEVD